MATRREKHHYAQASFEFVVRRFPQQSESIRRLFQVDESFRSLCKDYQVCANALDHWCQATSDEAPDRQQEYAALLKELEDEVLLYLRQSTRKKSK